MNNVQTSTAPVESSALVFSGVVLGKNRKSEEIFLLISTEIGSLFLFAR